MNRIAIVGMSCRLPGASSPDELWQMLVDGKDAVGEVPASRWSTEEFYDRDPNAAGAMYTTRGGFLENVDLFDPACFGVAPREALHMDPQQRLMLELAWEVFEDAGIAHQKLAGSPTGVFIGFGPMEYALTQLQNPELIDAYTNTGYFPSIISNRISYVFDLRGPSLSLDTACSASLVAVKLACDSLRLGETNLALAGGVNLMVDPTTTVAFCKLSALSPHGRCKTFDAEADGYVRGEGAGIVLLKRFDDAIRDGNRIYATILGEAITQDGRSNGLTAPNRLAQEEVLQKAYRSAGIEPKLVQYVEAHGTGTFLGDPIEVSALGNVLGRGRDASNPLRVGSLKTNIGHLESAAGISGLIKLAKCIQHRTLVPHLHFNNPNPHIDFTKHRIAVVTERQPWPDYTGQIIAGISAFGFGGTNAHLVLSDGVVESSDRDSHSNTDSSELLVLSARDPAALEAMRLQYRCFLEDQKTDYTFAEICHAAATTRNQLEYRTSVVANSCKTAAQSLAQPLPANVCRGLSRPTIGFLFTGQGAQYLGMGRELWQNDATFRRVIDECDALMNELRKERLSPILFDASSAGRINETQWTQPAVFALQWGLYELWKSWGIQPDIVLGHSIGEIAGACSAGMMSWQDGFAFAATRGSLMQSLQEPGGMIAILGTQSTVDAFIANHQLDLELAVSNSLTNWVFSGKLTEIDRAVEITRRERIQAVKLNVSHAFHSTLMDPILNNLGQQASDIAWTPSTVPFVANLTGEVLPIGTMLSPEYFQAHARSEVKFSKSVASFEEFRLDSCLELGPCSTLNGLAKSNWTKEGLSKIVFASSLSRGVESRQSILEAAGRLFERGHLLRWEHIFSKSSRFVSLPKYPFQRQRYWEYQPARRFASDRNKEYSAASPPRNRLLGNRLDAVVDIFQSELSAHSPSWINDHRVGDQVVMPAAAYIDMALSLVAETQKKSGGLNEIETNGDEVISLESIRFQSPLLFSGRNARRIQCFAQEDSITIVSFDNAKKRWTKHCTAKLSETSSNADSLFVLNAEGDQAFWQNAEVQTASELYGRLSEHGLQYGPAFRGIERVLSSRDAAWAEVVESPEFGSEESFISPRLLDSCFQAVACLISSKTIANDRTYIPAMVQRVTIRRCKTNKAYCRVLNIDASGRNQLSADLYIFDEQKRPIAIIEKLRLIAANLPKVTSNAETKHWIRQEKWVETKPIPNERSENIPSSSAVFELISALHSSVLAPLQEALIHRGSNCVVKTLEAAGDPEADLGADQNGRENHPRHSTIVFVLEPSSTSSIGQDEYTFTREQVRRLHRWFKCNAARADMERILFVTVGGMWTGAHTQAISLPSHTVLGWIRSIRFEYPKLRIDHLDFDTTQDVAEQMNNIVTWIDSSQMSLEVAYRDGHWFRRVWEPSNDPALQEGESVGEQEAGENGAAILFEQKGSIDFLAVGTKQRVAPETDEVEIAIHSTGLNFRDVLNVLGMYPGDAGPLGGECSGIVTRAGCSVRGLKPGDRVAAILSGAFSDFGIAKAALTVKLPNTIALATGAALPIAFVTAALAIKHFGKIKPGDRVLVHAGTGGVGLAAIHLALRLGAEVYATAGSERKKRHLLSLGVAHVWNSRDKNFAESVIKQLGGRPFDVVLNSLSGDFIPASMALVNPGGRFVEIGKIGVWTHDAVSMRFPDIYYHPFDLAELSKQQPTWIGEMLSEVIVDFSRGEMDYPVLSVPFSKAAESFRFMSQAKHIGKLVVTQPQSCRSRNLFQADGTYIVTGAMGGIGKQFIPWMMEQGAKHLELWMRRPLDTSEQELVNQWSTAGASISVRQVNGGNLADIRQAVESVSASGQRFAGVFHLAGVLQDSLVVNSDWDAYEQVLRAKAEYAWSLHQATEDCDLDYFVLFSSMTSLFGSPAQANYATANSFLDALAIARRSAGKTAHSIQWGPWRGAGMAADFDRRAAAMGIRLLDGQQALQNLARILRTETAVTSVIDLERDKFASSLGRYLPEDRENADSSKSDGPNVSFTARGSSLELVSHWKTTLAAISRDQRPAAMMAMVEAVVTKVLGLPEKTRLDVRQPMRELGLDSLMAVEMRNLLVEMVGVELDSTVLFDHPTIESLSRYLSQLAGERSDIQQTPNVIVVPSSVSEADAAADTNDELSSLTTQDLADELARELKLLSGESG